MISFNMLTPFARSLFALWALLLGLADIVSAVLALVNKRYRFTAASLVLFTPVYFLWQVIFDFSLFGKTEAASGPTSALCEMPLPFWLLAFVLLTVPGVLLLIYNVRYDKNFITPGSIKLFLDGLPCGICCWRENGRVLFSNVSMNILCAALTGNPLLNGNRFREAVKGDILTVDGQVWRFSCRDIVLDGEKLIEMVASDITAEYAKTEALEKDKADLALLNRKLKEYYLSMDDAVRRQEILQAKVNIHDEMNRLMLSTMAAGTADTAELDRIFTLWEQNALILCMEADGEGGDSLEELAAALKLELCRQDDYPEALSGKQRGLFFSAAKEAMVNAVKHAGAKTLAIGFEETEDRIFCRFTNDGAVPVNAVHFSGGLKSLALIAKKQGATVSAESDKSFTLTLCFPKNQPIG